MTKPDLLGPWVRRFLLEYVVGERHLAVNTQRSYRDTLALLIPFLVTATKTRATPSERTPAHLGRISPHRTPAPPYNPHSGHGGPSHAVQFNRVYPH